MGVQVVGVYPAQGPSWSSATIAIDGIFDRHTVEDVRDTVMSLQGTAEIWLDFGRTQSIKDFALVLAARALMLVDGAYIHLRGLSDHQDRVLRYLGFNPTLLKAPKVGAMTERG